MVDVLALGVDVALDWATTVRNRLNRAFPLVRAEIPGSFSLSLPDAGGTTACPLLVDVVVVGVLLKRPS